MLWKASSLLRGKENGTPHLTPEPSSEHSGSVLSPVLCCHRLVAFLTARRRVGGVRTAACRLQAGPSLACRPYQLRITSPCRARTSRQIWVTLQPPPCSLALGQACVCTQGLAWSLRWGLTARVRTTGLRRATSRQIRGRAAVSPGAGARLHTDPGSCSATGLRCGQSRGRLSSLPLGAAGACRSRAGPPAGKQGRRR